MGVDVDKQAIRELVESGWSGAMRETGTASERCGTTTAG